MTGCLLCGGRGIVRVPDWNGECVDWDSCPNCEHDDE